MKFRGALLVISCLAFSATVQGAGLQVTKLNPSDELAGSVCGRCAAGDFLITTGKLDVVVGRSHRRDESFYKFPTADALGSILHLQPRGTDVRGDIMVGTPYVRVDRTTRHVRYESLDIQRLHDRVTLSAIGYYSDERDVHVKFEGRYVIAEGAERVDISLTAMNVGPKAVTGFIYSMFFDPHQIYDFSPADADEHHQLQFRAYPRGMHLTGWMDRTPRVSSTNDHWGWDGGMILPDPLAVDLEPGERDSRDYTLFAAAEHYSVLRDIYREVGIPSEPVSFEFSSESRDYFELVVRDAKTAAIFFRAFLDRPVPLTIELPSGNYVAQANFFPGVTQCLVSTSREETSRCRMRDPPSGSATVRIVDSAGVSVPGKVSFHGIDPTPSPYFRPENPAYHEGYWESVKNSIFPVNAIKVVEVPVGSYRVSASRGPEFSMDERIVHIVEGETEDLLLKIDRVIDRPDLVSMDSHLHTRQSDGATDVLEKVRAIVAEGVDVAISTDHNLPVDYWPAVQMLGLDDELTVFTGAEVTVPERLDYNTYPMVVRSGEHNRGAIDVLSTDLSGRFKASRVRDRGVVLQINHPRGWQFDYFNWHDLDPNSAAHANEGFDLSFDVLEVVNGARYDTPGNKATRNDWFNLLRRGYFFPLVGTSDSHEIDQDEPGYSRTWVYYGERNGFPVRADRLMQRVREGRSFASNGPILDLTVADKYKPGDTLTAVGGLVRIGIDVLTAPWIDAAAIQIYINGVPQSVSARSVPHPTATQLRANLELQLKHDTFLVAEVRGSKDLHPVVQRRSSANGNPSQVLPYALTNPIFVDVDGNGKFDAPLPNEIELRDSGGS